MTDSDATAVVHIAAAREYAYREGFERFEGYDEDPDGFDFSPFTETAEYANEVLPDLRARSGHTDDGHGTYRGTRRVALVQPGDEDDRPADAELVPTASVYERLVHAYQEGARDAVDPDAEHRYDG